MADKYILRQHIKKVCIPNLKNEEVVCCGICPFEDEILEERPDLRDYFVGKRSLSLKSKKKETNK